MMKRPRRPGDPVTRLDRLLRVACVRASSAWIALRLMPSGSSVLTCRSSSPRPNSARKSCAIGPTWRRSWPPWSHASGACSMGADPRGGRRGRRPGARCRSVGERYTGTRRPGGGGAGARGTWESPGHADRGAARGRGGERPAEGSGSALHLRRFVFPPASGKHCARAPARWRPYWRRPGPASRGCHRGSVPLSGRDLESTRLDGPSEVDRDAIFPPLISHGTRRERTLGADD